MFAGGPEFSRRIIFVPYFLQLDLAV